MSAVPATPDESTPQAVASLFERHRRDLFRFCLRRLRSREEAEDAVQTTFLRAQSALDRGVVPEHETAWLWRIAHNVCLDRARAARRRARVEQPSDLEDLAVAAPDSPHSAAELHEALAELPERWRKAIVLREWRGLSYAEIARELGTTVPAVETLVFRARKYLAEALERRAAAFDTVTVFAALRALLGRLRDVLTATSPAKVAASVAVIAVAGTTTIATQPAPSQPKPRRAVAIPVKPRPIPRAAIAAPRAVVAVAQPVVRVVHVATARVEPQSFAHGRPAAPEPEDTSVAPGEDPSFHPAKPTEPEPADTPRAEPPRKPAHPDPPAPAPHGPPATTPAATPVPAVEHPQPPVQTPVQPPAVIPPAPPAAPPVTVPAAPPVTPPGPPQLPKHP